VNASKTQINKLLGEAGIRIQGYQPQRPISSFGHFSFPDRLMERIRKSDFYEPTPIQAAACPQILAGRDVIGIARTGSGKTAAFTLPALDRLLFRPKRVKATRVLIVTPTRELTQQCHSMIGKLSQFTDITCCAIVGGLSTSGQAQELRSRPDIVVATPGRLIDHVRNSQSVDLDDIEILILDEADRLLELGFMDEVKELVNFCPTNRQTMLFSATMTTSVNQLAELSLNRPVRIQADPLYDMASRLIQEFVRVKENRENDREAMVLALCTRSFKKQVIVFFPRKYQAHRFGILFGLCGLNAGELHGNLTQAQRLEALQNFRDGKVDYLLCTDLAARGLDISGVQTVINYAMPNDLSTYVHRVGRTARAGRGGVSVTLMSEKQRKKAKEVLKRSKKNVRSRTIPDGVISSFNEKIEDLQPDIAEVIEQEKIERQVRYAEL
jgi:ATP-dependent RNA helicase DDX27